MKIIILILTLMMYTNTSYSEIYKWVDENGNTHFSDSKPEDQTSEKLNIKVKTYTGVTFSKSTIDVEPKKTSSNSRKVIMYSTSWCGYCKKAKKYFKKKNIQFTEYDIEKNARARREYKKTGATGVPVIIVGKKQMNGFSVKGFEKIYN